MIEPALALVEFSSIAAGIEAADAMAKHSRTCPTDTLRRGMRTCIARGARVSLGKGARTQH